MDVGVLLAEKAVDCLVGCSENNAKAKLALSKVAKFSPDGPAKAKAVAAIEGK